MASSVVARFLDFWLSEIQFCLLRFIILALFSLYVFGLTRSFFRYVLFCLKKRPEGMLHLLILLCACRLQQLQSMSFHFKVHSPHHRLSASYFFSIFSCCSTQLFSINLLFADLFSFQLQKSLGTVKQPSRKQIELNPKFSQNHRSPHSMLGGFLSGSNIIMSQLWRCLPVEAYDSPTHSLWYWTWYERQLERDVAFWFRSLVREDWMNTTSSSALKMFCPHMLTQCWYHCQVSGVVSFTFSFLIHWCIFIIGWIFVLYALCAFPGDSGVSMSMNPISCGLQNFQVAQCLVVDIHCFWFQNRRYYSGGNQLTNTVKSSRREINLAQYLFKLTWTLLEWFWKSQSHNQLHQMCDALWVHNSLSCCPYHFEITSNTSFIHLSVVIQIPIFKHSHPVTTEARLLALSSLLVMLMVCSPLPLVVICLFQVLVLLTHNVF